MASGFGIEAGVFRGVFAIILRRRAIPLWLPVDRHGGKLIEVVGGAGLLSILGSASLVPVVFAVATNSLSHRRLMRRRGKIYI